MLKGLLRRRALRQALLCLFVLTSFLLITGPALAAEITLTVTKKNAAGHPTEATVKITGGLPGTNATASAYATQNATGNEQRVGSTTFTLNASGEGSKTFTIKALDGFTFKEFQVGAICPGKAVTEYFDANGKSIKREETPLKKGKDHRQGS